jgi:large subunit ribosomal protein L24
MKIKKDDKVIVISGKDKGKLGSVVKALPKENKVIVSGLNVRKVHMKARRGGEKGQVIEKNMPIHVSNVSLIDPKTNKPTRVGKKVVDGKKVRVTRKSGSNI